MSWGMQNLGEADGANTLTDCLDRTDTGGALGPVYVGNPAAQLKLLNAHQRRMTTSFTYLLNHLDPNTPQSKYLMDVIMDEPYRGDGPTAFEYVQEHCRRAPKAMDIYELRKQIMETNISYDIGYSVFRRLDE